MFHHLAASLLAPHGSNASSSGCHWESVSGPSDRLPPPSPPLSAGNLEQLSNGGSPVIAAAGTGHPSSAGVTAQLQGQAHKAFSMEGSGDLFRGHSLGQSQPQPFPGANGPAPPATTGFMVARANGGGTARPQTALPAQQGMLSGQMQQPQAPQRQQPQGRHQYGSQQGQGRQMGMARSHPSEPATATAFPPTLGGAQAPSGGQPSGALPFLSEIWGSNGSGGGGGQEAPGGSLDALRAAWPSAASSSPGKQPVCCHRVQMHV